MQSEPALSRIEDFLAWLPPWVLGLLLLAVAALAASLVYVAIANVIRRAALRRPFLATLEAQTRGPARLALILFALNLVLPSAPFSLEVSAVLSHALLLALIILLGWFALRAIALAAEFYLARLQAGAAPSLTARKHVTQVGILRRSAQTLVIVVTIAAALMTFESVRVYGVSLFASAGVAGLVVGLAARPLLSNLFAGIQLAITQPIRIGDAVVVENEWGSVEEITSTYVVIQLWDRRRLIVPLSHFLEKSFQNWTSEAGGIIGSVAVQVPLAVSVERLREVFQAALSQSKLWDGRVADLQVSDLREAFIQVQAQVSARTPKDFWELRSKVREQLLAVVQKPPEPQ
jgi:small-conductance mechanosensitive channel